MGSVRIALVGLCSGRSAEKNLAEVERLVRAAAAGGARYVQTPENTLVMDEDRDRLFVAAAPPEPDSPLNGRFAALAAELGVVLHIGSVATRLAQDRLANRSLLFTPDGRLAASYDKIHLFDVDLPGGESYRESQRFAAGDEAVVVELPFGRLGLSVCYDLRFAALYRTLAKAGAGFLAVPSAFTRQTGEAHWEMLLRARAIETGSFVLAAAQGGRHENGRETWGRSLVVSPWGEVIAMGEGGPGVVLADLDPAMIAAARRCIPALTHDRAFTVARVRRAPLEAAS